MTRAPTSLRLRLLLALLLVWSLGAAAVLTYLQVQAASPSEILEDASLASQARELLRGLRIDAAHGGAVIHIPARWRRAYAQPGGAFFTLYDPGGRVAAISSNLKAPLPLVPLDAGQQASPLRLLGPDQWLAITAAAPDGYRLVAARANSGVTGQTLWDQLSDFGPAVLFILVALVGLVVAWWVAGWSLRPLGRAAREAAAIGPERMGARLTTDGLPAEVRPLAEAVNIGLARVADAYASEKRFTAEAAHALRTPLTVLGLRLQRAEQGGAVNWAAVRSDLAELTRLISGLLALARADRDARFRARAPVNLSRLAREAVAAAAMSFDAEDRAVEIIAPAEVVTIQGDEGELREMVFALLDNALVHGAGRVAIDLHVAGAGMILLITDEGAGLPPAAWEAVFERFHKQSATSPGAGLGLAIVRQIARAHGGEAQFVAPSAIEVRLGA